MILIGFFMALFFLVIMQDPFFGDGISTVSRASYFILDSGYTSISYPPGQDPGHPITFPLIYAALWSVFGKSLIISHAFNFLFAFGIVYLVFRWTNETWGRLSAVVASLLLLLTPLFAAQSAMINTHLPLTFFTLLLAYSLEKHWRYLAALAAAALILTHLQGLFCIAGIMIWWFWVKQCQRTWKFRIIKSFKLLIIPALLFAGWLAYHYQVSGWLMSTPASDYYGRGYGGLKISLVNLGVSVWRMIDYGQIAFFIPIVILFFKRKLFGEFSSQFAIFLILFAVTSVLFSFTTTLRTAHRYFLPILPFLIMASTGMWVRHGKKWWMMALVLVLFSGHFWQYPGRTVGDATFAYRNIFPLLEEMNTTVMGEPLHTYAPLSDANEFAYLKESPVRLNSLYDKNIDEVKYVLRGNISGDFSEDEIAELEGQWPNHTIASGGIYLTLYVNPAKPLSLDTTSFRKRETSSFERWFTGKKKRMRAE